MMEFAKEKSCLYYSISYWLIMKYKYANRIFYIDDSDFIFYLALFDLQAV